MKIGVITFWDSQDNYGQILQCYALQRYLRNQGHDAFLIRYKSANFEKPHFKWSNLFKYISKLPTYITWFLGERRRQQNAAEYAKIASNANRHFSDFIKDNIACTEQIYNQETILQNPPTADAYICGSDQIWGGEWAYYLNFAPTDKVKIAYAPSLGGISTFTPAYEEKMRSLLKCFSFIGMREQSGVEVCHRLGRKDAVKVIDPTLLLSQADYDKVRIDTRKPKQKPYLFAYILGNPMNCDMKDVYVYAAERGLEVKYATSGKADNYEHLFPQIGEWIDLIANAEIVVTNSFHGTVFSLIYNRPFVTVLLTDGYERMNTRVLELLETTGLSDRIYTGDFSKIIDSVDFSAFNDFRSKEEKRSSSYLSTHLS